MNGSRSNPSRPGGSSSLDALSRTIEGLEARIEGLMNNNPRGGRPSQEPRRDFAPENRDFRERDPLAEIRQRQRALEEGRGRPSEPRSQERYADRTAPAQRFTPQQPPARSQPDASREISQALLGLRQDLKHDISESLAAEIGALRSEMRSIRALAEDRRPAEDMRHDIARLADGISELGRYQAPGTERLQAEFEELRSLMDGLAREDSVRHIERRWDDLEERLDGLDAGALRSELLSLADRLDDIKRHLGNIGDHGAIRALEDKLVTVATALEHIGAHIDPSERMLMEQFAGIDMRLDEITRAIAAGTRHSGAGSDAVSIGRIEDRIAGIAQQIEAIAGRAFEQQDPTTDLGLRLEALTARIEELGTQQTARRLEERLDQLSDLLERGQQGGPQPELTGYLADISRKIDALDQGAVSERLADRLDVLAERISSLAVPAPTGSAGDFAFRELEQRLNTIVDRLEETAVAPAQDTSALRGLEEQIAHLSTLISSSPSDAGAGNGVMAGRVAALEDYIATSDEYIIEAARQAAETVMESYAHTQATRGDASGADLAALSALADHLKDLESVSRNSEERTHRTFEALHDTLVQIAEKLDQIDTRVSTRERGPLDGPTAPLATAAVVERHAQVELQPAHITGDIAPPVAIPGAKEHTLEAPEPAHNSKPVPKKAAKPSLLSGLGKRLIPGQKKDDGAPVPRTLVDPSPSIDASEMLPPEEANELLEPGSGAPDVRKILERVRATQAAQRESGNGPAADGDRTDYIAAARRAAQAAASEMDRTYRAGPAKTETGKAADSMLSRYRRPILMAVGAVLLVAMSMPLVNTLLRSDDPLPVTAAGPADDLGANQPSAGVDTQTTADASIEDKTAAAPTQAEGQPEPTNSDAGATPSAPAALTAPVSLEESSKFTPAAPTKAADLQAEETLSSATPVQAASAGQAASNVGAAVGAPAEVIAVPDAIKPASLVIAAKQGDPLALFEVAARYSEGRGIDGDFAEAAKWYKMAADKGFAPAMYRLANLYENGTGVERNVETARHYYELAAEKGNASAMHNLAVMHASGATGTQDYPTAAKWFGKAAELGVSDSQFNLAILTARGNGVPQNLVESYKWFAIAAKAGDKDAAKKRDEVANVMAPDQLEKARAAVDLWKPQPLNPQANSTDLPDEWAGTGVKTASVDMTKAIRNIQGILNNNGFDAGVPDGVLGEKTVTAIKAFQTSVGMEPTGKVTDKLVKELLARNK